LSLDAQITHDSTLRLELQTGTEVVALIKAGWLELLAATTRQHWTQLPERRDREILDAEDGPSEVRIALPNGQTLCALAGQRCTGSRRPTSCSARRCNQRCNESVIDAH
jgi:molybdate transport system regulatory protein